MAPYTLVLVAVLLISPFAIMLAQKQDKKTKSRLKHIFLFLLLAQIILASASWQILLLFLAISLLQFFLLLKKPSPAVVVLNFINTFVLFITMARLSRPVGNLANLAAIAAAFLVLTNNVIGLLLINKEKRLKLKPLSRRGKIIFSFALSLIVLTILGFSYWNKSLRGSAVAKVAVLPEVVEYLREVPSGQVVIDHEDKETNSYLVHVYEIKDGHTATFNWYEVDKTTHQVSPLSP